MLLRFGVENHRSIREKQELSLVASPLDDVTRGLITCSAAHGRKLLPAVVIYGANASGKSTLVSALRWMREAILQSHSRGEPGGSVPISPFLLDVESATNPTICDMDFTVGDVRYHYGFSATKDAFTTEWLYSYPNDRRQSLFEREGVEFSFGRGLKGKNRVISELTRPNSLFMSAAAQNGHTQISNIVRFFRSIHIDNGSSNYINMTELKDAVIDRRVIDFLKNVGTGVVDYRMKEKQLTERSVEFRQTLYSIFKKNMGDDFNIDDYEKPFEVKLGHAGNQNNVIYLDFLSESAGTKRLLILLNRLFKVLDEGSIMVSDELNASLHTQACEALLALFSLPSTNP